jgi:hypothetical protein
MGIAILMEKSAQIQTQTRSHRQKCITALKKELLIRRAQQTIELSHFMCGFMADKEDCPLKDNPAVTVSYLEQVRHDRLSQMMAKEVLPE